jgi:hypothetical protein
MVVSGSPWRCPLDPLLSSLLDYLQENPYHTAEVHFRCPWATVHIQTAYTTQRVKSVSSRVTPLISVVFLHPVSYPCNERLCS